MSEQPKFSEENECVMGCVFGEKYCFFLSNQRFLVSLQYQTNVSKLSKT